MSEEAHPIVRVSIRPEPRPDELVAILTTLQQGVVEDAGVPETPSRWAEAARREQLRLPLDVTRSEW